MEDIEDMFKNDGGLSNDRLPQAKRKMVRKNQPKQKDDSNTQEDGIVI